MYGCVVELRAGARLLTSLTAALAAGSLNKVHAHQDGSMLTFEGEKIMGAAAIAQKLVGLPFQTVKHEVVTVDSQPTGGGGVLVSACGNLKVDGSEHPMKFSQVFCLLPNQNGGWFCFNDVFRLNYG